MTGIGLRSPRTDATDERPITKQPWYKAPQSLYPFDWGAVNEQRKALQDRVDQSASQLKEGS